MVLTPDIVELINKFVCFLLVTSVSTNFQSLLCVFSFAKKKMEKKKEL